MSDSLGRSVGVVGESVELFVFMTSEGEVVHEHGPLSIPPDGYQRWEQLPAKIMSGGEELTGWTVAITPADEREQAQPPT